MKMDTFTVRLSNNREIAISYSKGSEDLLFCIHSLIGSKDSFCFWKDESALRGYSFLAPDLFGFGSSDRSDLFSYTMEAHAEICAALLQQFSYKQLHLVAHSMGGAIALLLPQQILDTVESFANIEGNLIAADCGIVSRRAAETPFHRFESEIFPEYKTRFAKYTSLDSTSSLAFHRSSQSLIEWSDSSKLFDKFVALRCRKSYFYGEENRNHPTVSATADLRQVEITKSGHFLMQDNPVEFYFELAKFIRDKSLH